MGRARLIDLSRQFREILARSGGSPTTPDQLAAISETVGGDSALALMAEHIGLTVCMEAKMASRSADPERLLLLADMCAGLHAKLREHHGVDPETDIRRAEVMRKGRDFVLGPRRPRRDALARLIDTALERDPPAAAKVLLCAVREIDGGATIQEVDEDGVIWWRAGGREHSTSFKAFMNRVAGHRKKNASRSIPLID